ncbi:hypothetical protein EK904_004451, partial [Melospiza melodia maxima]
MGSVEYIYKWVCLSVGNTEGTDGKQLLASDFSLKSDENIGNRNESTAKQGCCTKREEPVNLLHTNSTESNLDKALSYVKTSRSSISLGEEDVCLCPSPSPPVPQSPRGRGSADSDAACLPVPQVFARAACWPGRGLPCCWPRQQADSRDGGLRAPGPRADMAFAQSHIMAARRHQHSRLIIEVDEYSSNPTQAFTFYNINQGRFQPPHVQMVDPVPHDAPKPPGYTRFEGRYQLSNGAYDPRIVPAWGWYPGSLPYEYKIVIAGNHELTFDQEFMADLIKQDFYYFPSVSKLKPESYENVQSLLTNCIYLQDSEV